MLNSTPKAPHDESDGQVWTMISESVQRLETSWATASSVSLASLLPGQDHSFRRRILLELIKVDQEYRWKSADRKLTEQYLDEWPELGREDEVVLELLEAECLTRAVVGELPEAAELQRRFPGVAHRINLQEVQQRTSGETMSGPTWTPQIDSPTSPSRLDGSDPVDAPPLQIGQPFGRYEINALLGEGGMGWVYHAYDTLLQRDVALKVPRFCLASDSELAERFLRESQAAARIEHPHVCTVHDAGEIDGVCFLTMRLVRGESLAQRLRSGPLAPVAAAQLARKLASALSAIHRCGILHRDIKTSNILLNEAGEPLLTDFGLARPAGTATLDVTQPSTLPPAECQAAIDTDVESNTDWFGHSVPSASHTVLQVGTIHYMPPELFQNRPPDIAATSTAWGLCSTGR